MIRVPEVDKGQEARLVALAPALALTDLVKGAVAMMSINEFAYRIGPLSVPPAMTVKPMRRAIFVALAEAAIALGVSPAIAENQDQVKVVFEHALPNVEGKRMVSVVVSYPPGAKSPAHRHAASALSTPTCCRAPSAARSAMILPRSITQAKAFTNRPMHTTGSVRTRATRSPPACSRSLSSIPRTIP